MMKRAAAILIGLLLLSMGFLVSVRAQHHEPVGPAGDRVPVIHHVVVPAGDTLIVPAGESLRFGEGRIDGTLVLAGRIDAQTILVGTPGHLITEPGAEIVIADRPFSAHDPDRIGNGLLVLGRWTANGTPKTAYARIADGGYAGSQTLTLEGAVDGWQEGDTVCLADTRQIDYDGREGTHMAPAINSVKNTGNKTKSWCRRPDHWQHETATIASVDGDAVTLAEPLRFDHTTPPGCEFDFGCVANLTRDVVLRSENPAGNRGHTIILHGGQVNLTGVEIRGFGRTTVDLIDDPDVDNQNGRYALHFHHAAPRQRAECVAVNGSPKWGIALHGTPFSQILDSVVWMATGAGIVLEDGNEVGSVIIGSYVGACTGSGEKIDQRAKGAFDKGHEGTGFWLRAIHQAVIEADVAEGCYHSGFGVFQFPPPSWGSIDMLMADGTTVSSRNLKSYCQAYSFAHNTAGGAQRGFEIWNHNLPIVFDDLTAYACSSLGFGVFYVDSMDLRNSRVHNDPRLLAGVGVGHEGTEGAGNMNLSGVVASGCDTGVRLVPIDGLSTIDGCRLLGNGTDLYRRNSKAKGDVRVEINNTAFDSFDLDWQGRWHWTVETILRPDQTFVDGQQCYFAEQSIDWGPLPETVVKERPGKLPIIQFEGAPEPGMTNADMIEAGLPPVAGEIRSEVVYDVEADKGAE